MKKSAYSEQREMIVAEAINPIATELRLLDPADLISLLRFECYSSIADLVSSAAELYYHPGTINFAPAANTSSNGKARRRSSSISSSSQRAPRSMRG